MKRYTAFYRALFFPPGVIWLDSHSLFPPRPWSFICVSVILSFPLLSHLICRGDNQEREEREELCRGEIVERETEGEREGEREERCW